MLKFLAKSFLRLTGWQAEGQRPVPQRYVLIAAPHTSNWDLAYLLAFTAIFDVKMRFMAKHQLFWGPLGPIMRKLGGIPVRRDRKGDLVQVVAGADKGKQGRVLGVDLERGRVRVEKVRMQKRHLKPGRRGARTGGIVEQEGMIDASNVLLVDPSDSKPSRIGIKEQDGKRVRVFKRSGDPVPEPSLT